MSDSSFDAATKLYYFEGRNTPIAANSAAEARKKKKRGGDKLVKVREPNATEKKQMSKGTWVRTRKDGKSPEKSKHGKGRGYGPPRKKSDKAGAVEMISCQECDRKFLDVAAMHDHAEAVHTFSERRQLVSTAVRSVHGKDAYLVDVADDWLVFDTFSEEDGGYKLLKQSYSMTPNGDVTLSGEPVEVVRKVSYVPAPKVEVAQRLGISFATDQARSRTHTDVAGIEQSQHSVELPAFRKDEEDQDEA